MFNLGFSEIILIAVLALVLFGPDKLPELAKTVAHFIKEFRRMSGELQSTVHETVATLNEETPKAPNLKELYDRIDPKRAIETAPRPFADPVPGTVVAAAAVDGAMATSDEVARAMGASAADVPANPDAAVHDAAALGSGAASTMDWTGHMSPPPDSAAGPTEDAAPGTHPAVVPTTDLLAPAASTAPTTDLATAPKTEVHGGDTIAASVLASPPADTSAEATSSAPVPSAEATLAPPTESAAPHSHASSESPALSHTPDLEKPAASENIPHEQIADRT